MLFKAHPLVARACILALAGALSIGCSDPKEGDTGNGGLANLGGGGTKDEGQDDPDTATDVPSEVTGDVGPEIPPGEPAVDLLGIIGLEHNATLACPGPRQVKVIAANIQGLVLRLVVKAGSSAYVVPVDAQKGAGDGATFEYTFDVDFDVLTGPPWNVVENGNFELWAIAFEAGADPAATPATAVALPKASETIWDKAPLTFDHTPPTLTLKDPDPKFAPLTMMGAQRLAATAVDNVGFGRLTVVFDGLELANLAAPAGTKATWNIDTTLDLSKVNTVYAPFTITVFDHCGLPGVWEESVKVVKKPYLEQLEVYRMPIPDVANDLKVVGGDGRPDWNGDGFADLVIATASGIFIALNDGKGALTEFLQITKDQSFAVAPVDFDGDERVDLAAVDKVNSVNYLRVHRHVSKEVVVSEEKVPLDISSKSAVRGIIAADFTKDPADRRRDDIVVATNADDETLLLFARKNPEQPNDVDGCHEEPAPPIEGAPAEGTDPGTVWVCPTLFKPPLKAAGVANIGALNAADVTGPDGPDGYLDIVVGTSSDSHVVVFPNIYSEVVDSQGQLPFAQGQQSFAWPDLGEVAAKVPHFCLGNFIETGADDDPIDLVAAPEEGATWRVMRGRTNLPGQFDVNKPPGDPMDILSMSGVHSGSVSGLVCADFDGDGRADFAIMSNNNRILQVHLGDGKGRFNQDPASPMLNPMNEGIGFGIGSSASHLRVGDFNADGLPDLVMALPEGRIAVILNETWKQGVFDLDAPRALMTPLGRADGSVEGQALAAMAIGDFNGDGKAEVIASTVSRGSSESTYLKLYHPMGKAYRGLLTDPIKSTPDLQGMYHYVWRAGTYQDDVPSVPAAYDQIKPSVDGALLSLQLDPQRTYIRDFFGDFGPPGDGLPDVILAGSSKTIANAVIYAMYNSAPSNDFWDPAHLLDATGSMFRSLPGHMALPESARDVEFVNPGCLSPVPGILVGTQKYKTEPEGIVSTLRYCPWDPTNDLGGQLVPFWRCPQFGSYEESVPQQIPEETRDLLRIAQSGDGAGLATLDPCQEADLIVLSNFSSMTYLDWNPSASWPFSFRSYEAIGTAPRRVEMDDLDGDGIGDLVATVDNNVFLVFGNESQGPTDKKFQTGAPVDKNPNVKHEDATDVAITDFNQDGLLDVVFSLGNQGSVQIYLNIGLEESAVGAISTKKFHRMAPIAVCNRTTEIEVYDFDGDGCEDIVTLCAGAGGVVIVENETCKLQPDD